MPTDTMPDTKIKTKSFDEIKKEFDSIDNDASRKKDALKPQIKHLIDDLKNMQDGMCSLPLEAEDKERLAENSRHFLQNIGQSERTVQAGLDTVKAGLTTIKEAYAGQELSWEDRDTIGKLLKKIINWKSARITGKKAA